MLVIIALSLSETFGQPTTRHNKFVFHTILAGIALPHRALEDFDASPQLRALGEVFGGEVFVDIAAELFAIAATCVRAEAQRESDRSRGEQSYELAEAFCQQATLRVERLFDALWTNTDDVDTKLGRNLLKGRYVWTEEGIIDQSEGTGPWIAHWEAGASTESDLARRFLTVAPT